MESIDHLVPVRAPTDILPPYRSTPIETLLVSHALGREVPRPETPELVILTCVDFRIELLLPPEFAFVIRTAGATVGPVLFNVTYAMTVPGVEAIAVIGHTRCRMVGVHDGRDAFLAGFREISSLGAASGERLFDAGAASFGSRDAVQHTLAQCETIRRTLDHVLIAPLFLDVDTGDLSQIVVP
jgi:carbonic anhydrase